jgi:hypothetical protein
MSHEPPLPPTYSLTDHQMYYLLATASVTGAMVAYRLLRSSRKYQKKCKAMELLEKWNPSTCEHRKKIEQLKPGFIDYTTETNGPVPLTYADAFAIYTSKPRSKNFELRFHFIELLNHFEDIAVAYKYNIVDRKMINESLKATLTDWHSVLMNFITVVMSNKGKSDRWAPFTVMVTKWQKEKEKQDPDNALGHNISGTIGKLLSSLPKLLEILKKWM